MFPLRSLVLLLVCLNLLVVSITGELKGLKGRKGEAGPQGPVGFSGRRGDDGDTGPAGFPGREGSAGLPGPPGEIGEKGEFGLPAVDGGSPGLAGEDGDTGFPGNDGEKGEQGYNGAPGPAGPTGRTGPMGEEGLPSETTHDHKFAIPLVMHSQSECVPTCAPGQIKMWDGYSLLFTHADGMAHSQDLGDPGSCVPKFSTVPFWSCDISDNCQYASSDDSSYWLSTTNPKPVEPANETNIHKYISRCVVCEVPTDVKTVHSQTTNLPECEDGYSSLWFGYSFVMYTDGAHGGGQSLTSSGSCLEFFQATPFIECNGATGHCQYDTSEYSFWMATIKDNQQYEKPQQEIMKDENLKSRISRCAVCTKKIKKSKNKK